METDVRWTIKVSKETDRDLRTYLARKGMKKGGLSRFVEGAVEKELFKETLQEAREANADIPAEELETLIEEEIRAFRDARRP
jgi:histone acetyltransferase (RNA polymerase elongator complex component)